MNLEKQISTCKNKVEHCKEEKNYIYFTNQYYSHDGLFIKKRWQSYTPGVISKHFTKEIYFLFLNLNL